MQWIGELYAQGLDGARIAAQLSQEGFHSARRSGRCSDDGPPGTGLAPQDHPFGEPRTEGVLVAGLTAFFAHFQRFHCHSFDAPCQCRRGSLRPGSEEPERQSG